MEESASWSGSAGLSATAGEVLEHLVGHPESTPAEVAQALGLTTRTVIGALRSLAVELLAVRVSSGPVRWSANPPRAALEALIARRRAQLATVEIEVERLQATYLDTVDRRFLSDQFEILDNPRRLNACYEHHLRVAEREVLHLVMPPYVAPTEHLGERMSVQGHAMARGVSFRSVYDSDTFDEEISLRSAREGERLGGRIRLSSGLPMKLVLFDDTAAIMTLKPEEPAAGSLLVYAPPLLQVLRALFEELWAHGVPWHDDRDPAVPNHAAGPVPDARMLQVLRFMALGMKDDAIARVLGVSRRTVQQSVTDVGALLGARTRFQIALHAHQRGWLDEIDESAEVIGA